MKNLEQLTQMVEMRLNDVQAHTNERQVAVMIKEFAEDLVNFKKANAALLAVTQDSDIKETFKGEFFTKVTLANDQMDVLFEH